MSCLPLDHEALALLRRLRPQDALAVLQQASLMEPFLKRMSR